MEPFQNNPPIRRREINEQKRNQMVDSLGDFQFLILRQNLLQHVGAAYGGRRKSVNYTRVLQ